MNTPAILDRKILFFASRLLWNLKLAIPYAILLTTAVTIYLMISKNELTVIMISGISFVRANMPFYLISIFFCGIIMWLNQTILPDSLFKSELTRGELLFTNYLKAKFDDTILFVTADGLRSWKIASVEDWDTFANLSISKRNNKGELEIELSAKKAKYSKSAGWEFSDCSITNIETDSSHSAIKNFSFNKPAKVIELKILNRGSDIYRKILGYMPESSKDILAFGKDPYKMTTSELINTMNNRDNSSGYLNTLNMQLYSRFFEPFLCIFYAIVGGVFIYRTYRRKLIITVLLAIFATFLCYFLGEFFRYMVFAQVISPFVYYLTTFLFFIILLIILNWPYINFLNLKKR